MLNVSTETGAAVSVVLSSGTVCGSLPLYKPDDPEPMVRSIFYFLLAGLCEIGGGYLVLLWIREGRGRWLAVAGAGLLVLYGVIPPLQPATFGRAYAAYGGVFVALSLLWGWLVDKVRPDRFDLVGAALVLAGVAVIMYWPRE